MFKAIKEQGRFKEQQTHYYLTQGDSCTITSTPYKDNQAVTTGISKCTFKLANGLYEQVLAKEVTTATNGVYIFNFEKADTENLTPGQYYYEIEYTMTNNSVQTPNSWKFDILQEIKTKA